MICTKERNLATCNYRQAHKKVDPTMHAGVAQIAMQSEGAASSYSLQADKPALLHNFYRHKPERKKDGCQQACALHFSPTAKVKLNSRATLQQRQCSVSGQWWMIVCLKRDLPSNAPSPNEWPLNNLANVSHMSWLNTFSKRKTCSIHGLCSSKKSHLIITWFKRRL